MSLLTVYRVEDEHTKGPYISQSYRSEAQVRAGRDMAYRHSDVTFSFDTENKTANTAPHLHPGPTEDHGMVSRWRFMNWSERVGSRHYVFGFPSTDRLGQWFFGERDTLELLNMHIAAYEVPHQAVVRGEWQLAFRRPSATLVRTIPLAGLVE